MSYRDDHDAAIARAEALEREATQLREENAALARENEELEAERKRLQEPHRALAKLAGQQEPKAILRPEPPGRLVSSSLHAHTPLATLVAVSPMPALVVLGAVVGGAVAISVGAILGVLATFVLLRALVTAEERRERRLLADLPLPLDKEAYLAFLDRPHGDRTVVTVHVELASTPTPEAIETMVRAVRAGMSESGVGLARVVDHTLLITSPAIQTRSGERPDNVGIHRWFRRLVARALLPIASAHAVRSIRVS